VSSERRSSGFEPAGRIGPDQLGLPKRRARELLLAVAWRRVAGERLAARAEPRRVYRGVLEVEALDADTAESLRMLLPELAGRIAAGFPALGVRKCRLIESGPDEPRSRPREIRMPEAPG